MPTAIANQREIIDRRALQERLTALAEAGEPERRQVVEVLKQAFQAGRSEVRQRFERGASGTEVVRSLSFLVDQLIRTLYDFVTEAVYPAANPTAGEHLAIVAVGGYGRGELAPFSDIDLLFLHALQDHALYGAGGGVHALYALGCRPQGRPCHPLRRGQPAPGQGGPHDPHRAPGGALPLGRPDALQRAEAALRERWSSRASAAEFVEAKLAERDQRHSRLGDSRYLVEPNIKEGKGGLRDLHTLFWIAKYIYRVDDVSKLVELKVLSIGGVAALRAGAELPLDRALPPALARRARRGPAHLRPAERDRPPHGLHRSRRHPRRRALHEALLSSSPRTSAT